MNNENDIELIGGVEKIEIRIVDYDSRWKEQFQQHARSVGASLGELAEQIEHIGSTSVPGLAAKPIIDILVVVKDSGDEGSYLPQLEAIGYELRVREPGWHEHRMLRTRSRDAHIHVYSRGCSEIERTIAFRDRLRQNVNDRELYEQTKRRLAAQEWPDMNAYADAKSQVIGCIIAKSQLG